MSYIAAGRDRGKFLLVAADGDVRVVHEANQETEITTDERTVLLKLHGGVDLDPRRERESFVVREDDYIDYLAGIGLSAAVPVLLAAKLRRSHFLFLGYTMADWNVRVVLNRLWGHHVLSYKSWAVQPEPKPLEQEFWLRREVSVLELPLDQYVEVLARHAELESVGAPA